SSDNEQDLSQSSPKFACCRHDLPFSVVGYAWCVRARSGGWRIVRAKRRERLVTRYCKRL
ncbi:MAG: hypothetical protein KDG54_18925, partial [Geminicoccaceae bacterium]|nr:hypothetical protein [Geminicoccaceae bacterium]